MILLEVWLIRFHRWGQHEYCKQAGCATCLSSSTVNTIAHAVTLQTLLRLEAMFCVYRYRPLITTVLSVMIGKK